MLNKFRKYLQDHELSAPTIRSYITAIKQLLQYTDEPLTKKKLLSYKEHLIATVSPRTTNVKIAAINTLLKCLKKTKMQLSVVKIQQRSFIENILSEGDYTYMKNQLRKKGRIRDYFIIRLLCTTGARVSEFCQMKCEHIIQGYFEIYGKGKKYRRIYIPKRVQREALEWIKEEGRSTGPVFINSKGNPSSPESLRKSLKTSAKLLKIDPTLVYPHSFRHLFARQFIKKNKDLGLLADLMGHNSIETTRIYLRQTAWEQRETIDKIVDW